MPFGSNAARMAFFEKLKLKNGSANPSQANYGPRHAAISGLAANIIPKMPDISKISLPKISANENKPLKFKKIKSFIKGF